MIDDNSPTSAFNGAIAQLVERVLCKHEVVGSIPSGSTTIEASKRSRKNKFPELAQGRRWQDDIVN